LEASPFIGEGHRKVWARLRILRGIRVSRARALRLMRENGLLSPHRRPQGEPILHDGLIQTDRPNEMWGTDTALQGNRCPVFAFAQHQQARCPQPRIPPGMMDRQLEQGFAFAGAQGQVDFHRRLSGVKPLPQKQDSIQF